MGDYQGGRSWKQEEITYKRVDFQPRFSSTSHSLERNYTQTRHEYSTAHRRRDNERRREGWQPNRPLEYYKRTPSPERRRQRTPSITYSASPEREEVAKKLNYSLKIPESSSKFKFVKIGKSKPPLESSKDPPSEEDSSEHDGLPTLSVTPPEPIIPCLSPSIVTPLETEMPVSSPKELEVSDEKTKEVLEDLRTQMEYTFSNYLNKFLRDLPYTEVVRLFNLAVAKFQETLIEETPQTTPELTTTAILQTEMETESILKIPPAALKLPEPNDPPVEVSQTAPALEDQPAPKKRTLSFPSPVSVHELSKLSSTSPQPQPICKRRKTTPATILIDALPMKPVSPSFLKPPPCPTAVSPSPIRKTTPSLLKAAQMEARMCSDRRKSVRLSLDTPPLPEVRKIRKPVPTPPNFPPTRLYSNTASRSIEQIVSSSKKSQKIKQKLAPKKTTRPEPTTTVSEGLAAECWRILDKELENQREAKAMSK